MMLESWECPILNMNNSSNRRKTNESSSNELSAKRKKSNSANVNRTTKSTVSPSPSTITASIPPIVIPRQPMKSTSNPKRQGTNVNLEKNDHQEPIKGKVKNQEIGPSEGQLTSEQIEKHFECRKLRIMPEKTSLTLPAELFNNESSNGIMEKLS